ncbi:MAG: hypothetical protein KBC43_09340 [Bacteroidales bacterium]|nr:hypothetical protein [Bacteroidales bacterium]
MTEKSFKYIQWLLYGLMAISAIFGIIYYIRPGSLDLLMYWGYILAVVAGVATLSLAFLQIFKNPKGSRKVLIIVGGMILIGIISWAMSKNTYSPAELERYKVTATGVKLVSTGLYMTYFIAIIAIGVFLYTSFSRFFNK